MKRLPVMFFPEMNRGISASDLSRLLNQVEPINEMTFASWNEETDLPEVKFVIAYSTDSILLKYFVSEKELKACHSQINAPVYKDSCVEFFIGFEDNGTYYNFEFNCLGNALVQFGLGRKERFFLPADRIEKIQSQTVIQSANGMKNWELTLSIPFEVFFYHNISVLRGRTCLANFHKCGDDLQVPHYLTWNNIVNDTPDFHLPEHFGELLFL